MTFKTIFEKVQYAAAGSFSLFWLRAFHRTSLRRGNLSNILLSYTAPGIIAIGMTFVILTGGVDLSVGSVAAPFRYGLGNVPRYRAFLHIVAVLVGVFVGAVLGTVTGLIVTLCPA